MSAALAVGGTLLGAVVGSGLALLRDRVNWSREDVVRWHETRFKAYAAFLTAARDARRIGVVVAISTYKHVQRRPPNEPSPHEERGRDTWIASYETLREQRSTLELVGSRGVVAAAARIEIALSDYVAKLTQKIASVPRTPGDDMTIGEMLDRDIAPPDLPPPDPVAAKAAEEAEAELEAAFSEFVASARVDLAA